MINVLFEENSEQEIMSFNGGCGGSASDFATPEIYKKLLE